MYLVTYAFTGSVVFSTFLYRLEAPKIWTSLLQPTASDTDKMTHTYLWICVKFIRRGILRVYFPATRIRDLRLNMLRIAHAFACTGWHFPHRQEPGCGWLGWPWPRLCSEFCSGWAFPPVLSALGPDRQRRNTRQNLERTLFEHKGIFLNWKRALFNKSPGKHISLPCPRFFFFSAVSPKNSCQPWRKVSDAAQAAGAERRAVCRGRLGLRRRKEQAIGGLHMKRNSA